MRNVGITFSTIILSFVLQPAIRPDNLAYMATGSDQFGSIDLNTGVFTQFGNMGQLLSGLGVAGGNLYGGVEGGNTLYHVNVVNGSLSVVGTGSINYLDTGSTTGGLYAIDQSFNLYSINAATGATTLIGSTGLTNGIVKGLSTGAGALYFTDGTTLYSLNTTTGAATLIGSTGLEIGALVFENGALYAGADSPDQVYTLNTSTGAATLVATASGGITGHFWGLAPQLPTGTPEPSSLLLVSTALVSIGVLMRRRLRV